jgi:hypothetical protein
MTVLKTLILDAAAAAALNIPFGHWRGGARRFSPRWFLAIHAPVPLVVGLRILSGLMWSAVTLAVLMGASVLGQLMGGRLRHRTSRRTAD